jgi:acid phosphatase (class A)
MKPDSYPSGHASIGWAWALTLAQLDPERANAIFQRGLAFGQGRVVCGVHWKSDVDSGRIIGAATVARLQTDPVFLAQIEEARRELAAARAAGSRPKVDCAAEAAALAADR